MNNVALKVFSDNWLNDLLSIRKNISWYNYVFKIKEDSLDEDLLSKIKEILLKEVSNLCSVDIEHENWNLVVSTFEFKDFTWYSLSNTPKWMKEVFDNITEIKNNTLLKDSEFIIWEDMFWNKIKSSYWDLNRSIFIWWSKWWSKIVIQNLIDHINTLDWNKVEWYLLSESHWVDYHSYKNINLVSYQSEIVSFFWSLQKELVRRMNILMKEKCRTIYDEWMSKHKLKDIVIMIDEIGTFEHNSRLGEEKNKKLVKWILNSHLHKFLWVYIIFHSQHWNMFWKNIESSLDKTFVFKNARDIEWISDEFLSNELVWFWDCYMIDNNNWRKKKRILCYWNTIQKDEWEKIHKEENLKENFNFMLDFLEKQTN